MSLAPICLFVYNRPIHTQKVLKSLLLNKESRDSNLVVFSDGYSEKSNRNSVLAVRKLVNEVKGFKSISVHENKTNLGLSNSILKGVSEVVNKFGRVIILEDDIVVSPYFLSFMNEGLELYQNDDVVISIHGYTLPVSGELPETFFLRGADCWGWATWKRGWELFKNSGEGLLKELESKSLTHAFDFDGTSPYTQMLRDQVKGKIDSWAIRWYASAFLEQKLTLYPSRSLVRNIGMDGTGTHCPQSNSMNTNLSMKPVKVDKIEINESLAGREMYKRYFCREKSFTKKANEALTKIKSQIKLFLKPLIPPFLLEFTKRFRVDSIYYSEKYFEWESAACKASGYQSADILSKILDATLIVKSGLFPFERDSVLFHEPQYVYSLLSGIMIAQQRSENLNVLDYGGSLGSLYFQHRNVIDEIENLSWNVLEQSHFVTAGKEHLEDERLKFFSSIEEFDSKEKISLLLLSSVLQYLRDPYKVLDNLINLKPNVIVIERTPFLKNSTQEHLRIQNNPTNVCKSSYPCWFFLREKLEEKIISFGYEIKSRHTCNYDLSNEYRWGGAIFTRLS